MIFSKKALINNNNNILKIVLNANIAFYSKIGKLLHPCKLDSWKTMN